MLAVIVTACDEVYKKIAYWLNDMGEYLPQPFKCIGGWRGKGVDESALHFVKRSSTQTSKLHILIFDEEVFFCCQALQLPVSFLTDT